MIEATVCGTPVIAHRSGSAPEVIDEGVIGLIVYGEEQAIEAVRKVGRRDRRRFAPASKNASSRAAWRRNTKLGIAN